MIITESPKYALHDTAIDEIVCTDKGVELRFANGVYLLNQNGKETALSDPCRMVVDISGFDGTRIFEHITVTKTERSNRPKWSLPIF